MSTVLLRLELWFGNAYGVATHFKDEFPVTECIDE